MAEQYQKPATKSRGVMRFALANGATLYLGGANQTTPTASTTTFLAAGIPQNAGKTAFADPRFDDTNGHFIKHITVTIYSSLVASANPAAAIDVAADGTPTANAGTRKDVGDSWDEWNNTQRIFNFKLLNTSGTTLSIDVEAME